MIILAVFRQIGYFWRKNYVPLAEKIGKNLETLEFSVFPYLAVFCQIGYFRRKNYVPPAGKSAKIWRHWTFLRCGLQKAENPQPQQQQQQQQQQHKCNSNTRDSRG